MAFVVGGQAEQRTIRLEVSIHATGCEFQPAIRVLLAVTTDAMPLEDRLNVFFVIRHDTVAPWRWFGS